ncbi:hypothetical protein [Nocardia macrotermitis]|uniref:Uncharacterized protein n=1 Tax=Nocardia macrotermitis TaxID=2585198 RepID=A0A7K0CW11_9NOCA|nr:hypothetical protein [Nocardia macrotermitis]MQY17675.1 hypothetical protein [Nocardia macrotermitis]
MTHTIFPRRATPRAVLGDLTRRIRARYTLTPSEQHNLRLAHTPLAVVTASLGGHTRRG